MKFITIVMPLLVWATTTTAQKTKQVKRYLYHSHGISFQQFTAINKRIAANPMYQQTKNSTGTLDFGFITNYKKVAISYNLNAGNSLSGNRNKRSTSINFLGGSVDVLFPVYKVKTITVNPFVGLGFEKFKVKLNKDLSTVPFDSLLGSNNNQQLIGNLQFSNAFALYRFGLQVVIQSNKKLKNSVGLQVGYLNSFTKNDWKANDTQSVLNAPKDKLAKLFASIIFRYQLIKK